MTVTLAQAVDAILDEIVYRLDAQTESGGTMTDVTLVARGDRSEPRPDTPAVYATPQKMRVTDESTSQVEWWEMPVEISAVVQCKTPVDGYAHATDLAARARAVLLSHTSSNLGLAYVRLVSSGTFDPSGPWQRNADYYRATAQIRIRFTVRG